ncbi:type I restriction endonuclease subunit R [Francisella hispaniensis]|uniref:type I restriction endonuclease subunit R n=1 Tax=Francisella hispaniensis TaxID=622488 RepID=UPI001908A6F9|nr:type I restriction endonuclease subunit R [Francisella hispaniensis]MBK2356588.1 type I restriction endonuclease subunit R [Francisella hispaniensis]
MNNNLPPNTSENSLQQKSLKLLQKLGYELITKEQNREFRNNNLNDVILKDIAANQLAKINSYTYKGEVFEFSKADIERQIYNLNTLAAGGLLATNKKITENFLHPPSVEQNLPDGSKKSFSFKFIDFDNFENNVFHVTEEFSVERNVKTEAEKTRRADIVLFINGFPIVVIELKKSDVEVSKGISQLIEYQADKEIPKLFEFAQLLIAANNHSPQYATTGSPAKYFLTWKEEDQTLIQQLDSLITNRQPSNLDSLLVSLCSKSRLIEMFRFFILFDNNIKKIARYQQYYAISAIIESISHYDGASRKGGLIWHTQGSGKSLTMVMATKYLQKKIENARIVVVTDRKDLDKQISDTFKNSEVEVVKATTGRNLIDELEKGTSVITSTIHKFETAVKQNCKLESSNIFILVDESHRSQSGDFHRAMKKVFVNGCYIGFTGTPLLKSQKSDGSITKFNGLIHKYTIDQAIKDKAVLPLLYEARMVDQWITDEAALNRRFARYTNDLNEDQKKDLEQKWVSFRNVASSKQRLEAIVFDIEDHFIKNIRGQGFKAMFATNSKVEAVRFKKLFDESGLINSAVSLSAPDVKEGSTDVNDTKKEVQAFWKDMLAKYGSEKAYNDYIDAEFKADDGDIELLIVVDKLLTGFDAPIAQVLYIDKELKDHTLLQAIARVNRLYEGKDYGLIVDYRGLFENLDKALTSYGALAGYDETDVTGTFADVKNELQKLKTSFSQLQDLFKSITHKNDQESYEVFLEDKKDRQEFYKSLNIFARDLAFSLGCDFVNNIYSEDDLSTFKKWLRFYNTLRKSLRIRYAESVDFAQYEQRMQSLLDTYIGTEGEVFQLSATVDMFSPDFKNEVENLTSDRARADAIISATTKYAKEKREVNPAFYDRIAEKIKEIIQQYKEKRLSEREFLSEAQGVYAKVKQHNEAVLASYPSQISSKPKQSFYDSLKSYFETSSEDRFIQIVCYIDEVFAKYIKKPNWKNNIDVKNEIEQELDDYLFDEDIKVTSLDDFLQKTYELGVNNYD